MHSDSCFEFVDLIYFCPGLFWISIFGFRILFLWLLGVINFFKWFYQTFQELEAN